MSRPLITVFTTCKPFEGQFAPIQRNALRSWAALQPECEVLVIGDEPGVGEVCQEFGFRQVTDVARTESGTPLLDGVVSAAQHAARADVLALINADIMVAGDLVGAVEEVRARFSRFLMIARRWNVELSGEWSFAGAWKVSLSRYAVQYGHLEPPYGGVDLFVFPRGLYERVPPFAIGRTRWDSGLIYHARRMRVPVVDATERVICVHQNHDYSHHRSHGAGVFKGPEAMRNEQLLGGAHFIFSALNATHTLGTSGLRRRIDWRPDYLVRKAATWPALYRPLRPIAPIVAFLAPWWRKFRAGRSKGPGWKKPHGLPYPISVGAEPLYPATLPPGGGVECFDTPEALQLNRARLEHLSSLDLPVRGRRVIDVGCGVGHLAQFFVERGCDVLCIDGRQENVTRLRELYPGLKAQVFDLDRDDPQRLGRFDIVFAYGVLYHLENPFRVVRNLASICEELMLIETMVADHHLPLVRMAEETSTYSQALRNVGSRPTPSFVVLALRAAGFRHVYAPRTPPDHPDFKFDWRNDLSDSRDGHLLRCTFIASREPVANANLVDLMSPV